MQMLKGIWYFLQINSSGIQVTIAVLGLVVLCKYAWDTRAIARGAVEQSRTILLPFLSLTIVPKSSDQEWHIKNLGSGPAINITFDPIDINERIGQKAPIMPGETRRLCSADKNDDRARLGEAMRRTAGFEIKYESLSGEHLISRIKQEFADGAIDVKFVRERV